ncbi:MAG: phosphatidate cytidylyltransferase [Aliishimia sp.]
MKGEMLDLMRHLAWVGVLLLLASLVSEVLAQRPRIKKFAPVARNLRARARGWWTMAGVVALFYLPGPGGVLFLFAIVSMGALRELLTLTTRHKADHWAFVASFFVVLPIQYLSIWFDWYGFYAVFIPVYGFFLLPMLSVLRGRTHRFLSRVAETQWGLMVAVFCTSHLPALLYVDIPGFEGGNLLLTIFLVLVAQSADMFQHAASVAFGKTPIAPVISQSRTWEGFALGVMAAFVLGGLLSWLTPFGILPAAFMAAAIAGCGSMGRLVMAAIKRDRGVKDWGHMNDGQGGFIDRLDSVIFAAPIFFHLTRFFWAV